MRSRKVFFFYCFSALLLCTDVLVHTLICILLTLSNSHTRYFHSKLSMVLFNLQINFTVCCTLRGSVCIRVLISFANSGPRARPIRKKYMRLQRRTVSMKAIGLFCLLCRVFFLSTSLNIGTAASAIVTTNNNKSSFWLCFSWKKCWFICMHVRFLQFLSTSCNIFYCIFVVVVLWLLRNYASCFLLILNNWFFYFLEKKVRIDFWFLAGGDIFFLPLPAANASGLASFWLAGDGSVSSSEQLYSTVSQTVSVKIKMNE